MYNAAMIHKKKAGVRLSEYQHECDLNYLRLKRLLADFKEAGSQHLVLSPRTGTEGADMHMDLHTLQSSRYTTKLSIYLHLSALPKHKSAHFVVHAYRDVWSAETVLYQRQQIDCLQERHQLNCILGKWLSRCLTYGYEAVA